MPSAPSRKPPRGGDLPRPQQARSRRTRQRILDAAAAVFEVKGYDETTTTEIARKAGIAVGTLYGWFPDKRAILLEILHDTVEQMAHEIVGALDPELWIGADVRASARALIEKVFKTRRLRPGVQRILWERFFKDPEVRESMEAIEEQVQGAIETLLVALNEAGRARVADPAAAAFAVHAAVEWAATRLMLGGAPDETLDRTVDAVTEMTSRLILG